MEEKNQIRGTWIFFYQRRNITNIFCYMYHSETAQKIKTILISFQNCIECSSLIKIFK
jgi:hypothetical protein